MRQTTNSSKCCCYENKVNKIDKPTANFIKERGRSKIIQNKKYKEVNNQ